MSAHPRQTLVDIFRSALVQVSPETLVRSAVTGLGPWTRPPHLLSAGKAAAAMARGIQSELSTQNPLVVLPTEQAGASLDADTFAARHPVPDASCVAAAEACVARAETVAEDETLLCAISGGASSLLTLPAPGVSLDALIATQQLLLGSGLDIHSMNVVRKHLSGVKGGQLAARCRGTVISLILSDVADDDASVIASGPTVPDPSTFDDALRIIEDARLDAALPQAITDHLRRGATGERPETPKTLPRAHHHMVGGPSHLWEAARGLGREAGFEIVETPPPKDVGSPHADDWAKHVAETARGAAGGSMHVWVGEPTVTLPADPGSGGRNSHLALRVAQLLQGREGWTFLSAGSDGIDGASPAAGAVVDGTTWKSALERGLDPASALARFDSGTFHEAMGTSVVTGATGSNLLDLQILLIDPSNTQA